MTKGTAFRREAGADNRDDVIWDRRYKHRSAGLAGLYNSRDVIQMQVLISAGELSRDDVPSPPDPSDRSLSKRQWELRTAKYTSIMEGLQVHILYAFYFLFSNTLITFHLPGMQAWRSAVKNFVQCIHL